MLLRGQKSTGFRDKEVIGDLGRNSFSRGVRMDHSRSELRREREVKK